MTQQTTTIDNIATAELDCRLCKNLDSKGSICVECSNMDQFEYDEDFLTIAIDTVYVSHQIKKAVVDSIMLANIYQKDHDLILAMINRLKNEGLAHFYESSYPYNADEERPMYTMDRLGFTRLSFGFIEPGDDKITEGVQNSFDWVEERIKAKYFPEVPKTYEDALHLVSTLQKRIEALEYWSLKELTKLEGD